MSNCKIDGCVKEVRYREQGVCQKHYFRFMRNGYYELKRNVEKIIRPKTGRKERYQNAKGYQMIPDEDHPLAMKNGCVYEHRYIIYEIYGDELPGCELCGKHVTWGNYSSHIDHIDENVKNNERSNLRVLCNTCNTRRTKVASINKKNAVVLTYKDRTLTAAEWAREPDVTVNCSTIIYRLKKGMSAKDSLFSPQITHKKYHRPIQQLDS